MRRWDPALGWIDESPELGYPAELPPTLVELRQVIGELIQLLAVAIRRLEQLGEELEAKCQFFVDRA